MIDTANLVFEFAVSAGFLWSFAYALGKHNKAKWHESESEYWAQRCKISESDRERVDSLYAGMLAKKDNAIATAEQRLQETKKELQEARYQLKQPMELAPEAKELMFSVGIAPEAWNLPEPVVRQGVEGLILQGLTEQMKPYIHFDGPIYEPFQLPRIEGRLTIIDKGESTHDE